jgi:stage II sporulation protein E
MYTLGMRIRINYKTMALYGIYAAVCILLNCSFLNVPISLGVYFAMLACGTNIIVCPIIYIVAGLIRFDIINALCRLFEGAVLCGITLIYKKAGKKMGVESAIYVCLALAPFIAFCNINELIEAYMPLNAYIAKAIISLAICLFTYFCNKCVYSLLYKLYRCKLTVLEIFSLSAVYCLSSIGFINIAGTFIYVCCGICATLFFVHLQKSPTAIIASVIISLPPAIMYLNAAYVTAFIIICIAALAFCPFGKIPPTIATVALGIAAMYFYGYLSLTLICALKILLLICSCILPAALPKQIYAKLEENISLKQLVPACEYEQFKLATCNKLYDMSQVFREIRNCFMQIDDTIDVEGLKARMANELKQTLCTKCEKREKCSNSNVYIGFKKLIDCGCLKGKVNLVDLPIDVTTNCAHPTEAIYYINKLIAEYKRLTLEAENAKCGRHLLANQADGICNVLKDFAANIGMRKNGNFTIQKQIQKLLATKAITCTEIDVQENDFYTIALTIYGKYRLSDVIDCIQKQVNGCFVLKDKSIYDGQKCCLYFTQAPKYDAVFGVAHATKKGESYSGDTHSVIKIDEHTFLMALSDGMGSGQYAQQISSTTMSLIESFYRAGMPTNIIMQTINRLICLNKDETFTCIDIAAVNLNSLSCQFIKIGSPAGIIMRAGNIKILEANTLPLGILDSLHPSITDETLECDDVIIFMSDGITSAFTSSTELYEYIMTLSPLNPQDIAESILSRAKRSDNCNDDMTVLCTRIYEYMA